MMDTVCNVGKSQRITSVLQGYIQGIKIDDFDLAPEPATFLSAFFAPKQEEIIAVMEQTPREKRRYGQALFKEVQKLTERLYKEDPEKRNEVLASTRDFLRLSFEMIEDDFQEYEFSRDLASSMARWDEEEGRRISQDDRFGIRYQLRRGLLIDGFLRGDFIKGNIQSFIASQDPLRFPLSHFPLARLSSLSLLTTTFLLSEVSLLGEDLEEARNLVRLTQLRTSLDIFYNFLREQAIDEDLCFHEFSLFLEHLQAKKKDFFKRNNGMNDVDNAFRVLEKLRQLEDNGILWGHKIDLTLENGTPVTKNSLLAKTWWLIQRQVDKAKQDMLKESLVHALGYCIKEDGEYLSDIEHLEKITSVLKSDIEGLITEGINNTLDPDSFLSAFFVPRRQEMRSIMEKPWEEKNAYGHQLFEAIKTEAEVIFDGVSTKKKEVEKKATEFLRISLGL
ncbi:MAG: hypothetical protein JSS34_04300 [Proteobacteria bacterium]|nr:hypothetical protein [Pseudomonadota bacterium]